MILAVDCGNSALKAALVEGSVVYEARLLDVGASEADLAQALADLAAAARSEVDGVVVVSVVDRWTARLERSAAGMGLPLTVVAASSVPLRTALVRPDQTGPDRLLAAWAAWRLHGAPVIVIDMGTATTVDAVDADGFFLGGAIMPGPGLAAEALASGTARLPRVDLAMPSDVIGGDTVAAMRSGLVIGHIGAVREILARMRPVLASARTPSSDEAGAQVVRVVVTGGHARAPWARPALLEAAGAGLPAVADVIDPDLVLRGLGLLAELERVRPADHASQVR